MITGTTTFEEVLSLMHEDDPSIYGPFILAWFNITINDLYEINNRIRNFKGKSECSRKEITLEDLNDPLKLESELYQAIIYGVLCKVYAQENDTALLSTYMQQYEIEKQNADKWRIRFV